ncbi:MAG: sodium:proton antiporter NhaD [Candidatus Sericytochromatia bacterium]|uniref:Sodium:proton antiporter NhaD n=1 Tax=Candidatus Tanganyikabacteria bacterium TaxID=2961651 RepID=A0A938BIQ7_9BACT|nr:sodium:proton antiporter NhaD [Candidatus Tanganyikabacteria bacterium]
MLASTPVVANLTMHWAGLAALAIFVLAYAVVMAEDRLHIRKSLPVMVAGGVIWMLVATAFGSAGRPHDAEGLFRHNLLEFAELFLFLLAAMTFINTMEERGVFEALRNWLIGLGLSLRALFWVTGGLAFCISPIADNLTTALVMGAVAVAVGAGKPKFVALSCINVVVAANAGGAFSPFGDITTLMVWQKGLISFFEFFALFVPSLINWLVPAIILTFAIERGLPEVRGDQVVMKAGALTTVALLIGTIALAVSFHQVLHLPPVLGMMTGLGVLNLYAFYLKRKLTNGAAPIDMPERDAVFADSQFEADASGEREYEAREAETEPLAPRPEPLPPPSAPPLPPPPYEQPQQPAGGRGPRTSQLPALASVLIPRRLRDRRRRPEPIDVWRQMERTEWDTLLFFYGVILCVGGLGAFGYLALMSNSFYGGLGATWANVLVGILSAIVDNIPIMFAVLSMEPQMSHGQWLLVTLTAGVGGSLLSIGSAAGVALMGQARGVYTVMSHLRWSWAVALGYAASIWAHLLLNRHLF